MNNIKDKSEEEELLKEYNNKINHKFLKDPKNLSYQLDISKTNDSIGVNDTFEVFISYKDCNEYLISPNCENFNLDVYLLKNNQIIKSLEGHKNNILSIRYFLNNKNYNEYLISSDDNRTVIVWHITKNYKPLHIIDTKYSGVSYSCLLAFPSNLDKSFILTSTKHYSYENEKSATKIFSLEDGKFIKYIKDSNNYQVIYLLPWINKNNNKYYIIQVANFYILINDLFEDELYAKLSNDTNNDFHDNAFIYCKNKNDYLCTCTKNGFIHIWDLDHKNLFQNIQLGCGLITIIDWNQKYSIICEEKNNYFIVIDMETFAVTGKINSNHKNTLICIKKILHPTFGESLFTAGRDKVIKLFS
jgi:WD40 repeat protein